MQAWICIERSSRPAEGAADAGEVQAHLLGRQAERWRRPGPGRRAATAWRRRGRRRRPRPARPGPTPGPRKAWSCMPTSYSPRTTTSAVGVRVAVADAQVAQQVPARGAGAPGRPGAGPSSASATGGEAARTSTTIASRPRGAPSRGGRRRRAPPARPGSGPRRWRAPAGRRSPSRRSCGRARPRAVSTACTPGDGQRRGDVDGADAGARVRAAQRDAPEHPVHPQVRGVRELGP